MTEAIPRTFPSMTLMPITTNYIKNIKRLKRKCIPMHEYNHLMKTYGEVEVYLRAYLTSALEENGWSALWLGLL
jgi:hypothetical protein